MAPRTGRPPTGITPKFNVRVQRNLAEMARRAARAEGKRVGLWLEEAIREKLERREPNSGNVNERDDRTIGS